ncbi:MAG: CCA tRNA nucleotidyltransferase [Patescibacteria group bacterium]
MKIPQEIKKITDKLEDADFEAFVVGGCVRDGLLNKKPNDWDIATNATPEDVESIFNKTYSNNNFGTVTVLTESNKEGLKEVEITPYRTEENYKDGRHPEKVEWAETIDEDLSRRDFTINALAYRPAKEKLVDLFNGKEDLEKEIIRAVGDPYERFDEDSLRMMRAARFATTLEFKIEEETKRAIKEKSSLLQKISNERIREELLKIVMSDNAAIGIELLRRLGLLKYIIPELEEGYQVAQNKHHIYDCYEHSILSLQYAADQDYNMHVRMAALLHDVAKPTVKEGTGEEATFYNHEVVGAKQAKKILKRLKFPKKDIKKIVKLVRYHLFYYNVGEVSESSVRRLVRNVGKENIDDLIKVRKADRIGSGVPKAEPYKLRHLQYVIEKVSRDPISTKMLEVDGEDVMEILGISPGPKIGDILNILLSKVLSDPSKNKKDALVKEIKKLGEMNDEELKKLAEASRDDIDRIETKRDKMTKKKYWLT